MVVAIETAIRANYSIGASAGRRSGVQERRFHKMTKHTRVKYVCYSRPEVLGRPF